MSNLRAVITAGGRVDGEFSQAIRTSVKALAPFAGATFLDRTIDAVRGMGIERIAVVGGKEVEESCGGRVERVIAEAPGGAENLRRALAAWDGGEPLLYLTSDMPFIDRAALASFVDAAPPGALSMPLTEFDDFARRFPGAPPFGVTLAGRRVVNGGAFLIPANSAPRIAALAARFFDARKSPLAMARLAGTALLLQFLFKRLSVGTLEARAAQLLGMPASGVRGAPELAYDVDTYEEYLYAVGQT